MPGDPFAISGHLTEEVRAPRDHVLAQQVLHTLYNARLGQQIVDAAVPEMRCADRIAVAAGRQRPGEQLIEVVSNTGDLIFAEDSDPLQITAGIERTNQFAGQPSWILH